MIGLRLEVDTSVLTDNAAQFGTVAERLHEYVRGVVLPALQPAINNALNIAPGPVKTPFEFASAASRRYYFATHNGPYRRTGRVLSWAGELTVNRDTGYIEAVNRVPYAAHVFGPRQVPGHRNTGWNNAAVRVLTLQQPAERLVVAGWLAVNQSLLRTA